MAQFGSSTYGTASSEVLQNEVGNSRLTVAEDGITVAYAPVGAVRLVDVKSQKDRGELSIPDKTPVTHLQFSADGQFVAIGSADGSVRLWRPKGGQVMWKRQVFTRFLDHLSSQDGLCIAAVNKSDGAAFLDVRSVVHHLAAD